MAWQGSGARILYAWQWLGWLTWAWLCLLLHNPVTMQRPGIRNHMGNVTSLCQCAMINPQKTSGQANFGTSFHHIWLYGCEFHSALLQPWLESNADWQERLFVCFSSSELGMLLLRRTLSILLGMSSGLPCWWLAKVVKLAAPTREAWSSRRPSHPWPPNLVDSKGSWFDRRHLCTLMHIGSLWKCWLALVLWCHWWKWFGPSGAHLRLGLLGPWHLLVSMLHWDWSCIPPQVSVGQL